MSNSGAPAFSAFADDSARPDEREMVARWQRDIPGLKVIELRAEKGLAVLTRHS